MPVFSRFQVQTTVDLTVRKTSAVSLVQAKIIVVAFNVGGAGGIADEWRRNGLSGSSTVSCGAPATCVFPAPCSTIWVQLPNCATFDLARVRVVGDASEFTATTAIVVLEVTVRALPEGVYAFQLHLPVTDTVSWTYQSIDGRMAVVALADARLSNVALCQGAGCNSTTAADLFQSTNGALGPVVVRIAAADVHGFAILRSGEALSVVASGPSGKILTSPAVFDETSQQYVATLATLTVVGEYVVELISSLTSTRATKAMFTLNCAQGYVASSGGECALQRSVCDTLTAAPATAGFVIRDSLVLSNLGSANSVDLVPLSTTESFRVENGQATVRFVSPGTFLIRITEADGRKCSLSQQRQVGCPAGYIVANGGCQPIVRGDVCAGFAVKDQAGTLVGAGRTGFTVGDRLQVVVDASKASLSMYQFELVPKQGKVTGNATDPVSLDQPGSFSLDLAYTPPNGPPVRCPSLLPTVDVVASRSCDKLQATFVLGSSSARGATSSLRASVSLPAGLNANVIASPQDSSVPVHLSPSAAKSSSWEGSATLPSTGQWAIAVYAGQEPCILQSQVLNVSCMRGFEDDGQGCRCPQGLENGNGECKPVQQREPCEQAVVRSFQTNALVQRGSASFTAGTVVSVALGAGVTANGFRTLLVPTQGTEARNLSEPIQLNRTGQFSLQLEYPSAAGPKLCALISAMSVRCSVGDEEVGGKCRPIVKSPCEQATMTYSLSPDAALGAWSRMEATLKLPDGMDASIVATPLDNAVRLPVPVSQSGTLSAEQHTWEGSVSLPSTGAWDLTLRVGGEQCPSTSLQVGCMAASGFVDDRSGRCVCRKGHENKDGKCVPLQQEVDVCQVASVHSMEGTIFGRSDAGMSLRPGTQLSINMSAAPLGYKAILVPLQGSESFDATQAVLLSRSGAFALKLNKANSTQECTLIPRLEIKCAESELEVAGRCQSCPESEGFWLDSKGSKCKKKPRMEVKAASKKLSIKHVKARRSEDEIKSIVEVRLTSGDIDATPADRIAWLATSSAQWLRLSRTDGTVDSKDPVAEFAALIDATGFRDTYNASASGQQPLFGTIMVTSSMRDTRADLFEDGTHSIALPVELTIEAAPVLQRDDVEARTSSGASVASGSIVTAGDTLVVTVHTFDYERLPIARPGLRMELILTQDALPKAIELRYLADSDAGSAVRNVYRGEVPGSYIELPGEYTLRINSIADGTQPGLEPIVFTVTATNQSMYVGLGIALLPLGMLIALSIMLFKRRAHAKKFLLSFVNFEGFLVFEVHLPRNPMLNAPRGSIFHAVCCARRYV